MKVLNATVRFGAGKVFENKFGKSQNAKAILDNGTEITIWCKADIPNEIQKWKTGDKVQVIEDNGKFKAVETDKPYPPTEMEKRETAAITEGYPMQTVSMIEPPRQTKIQMLQYIEFQVKQYHFIFNKVCEEMEHANLKDELIKDISTSIFIQTNRKFNL